MSVFIVLLLWVTALVLIYACEIDDLQRRVRKLEEQCQSSDHKS